MASVKMSISLDRTVADIMRRRATGMHKPVSRYLADLVEIDAKRERDSLAAEGYRALSADTGRFASEALALAAEVWPEWREPEPRRLGRPRTKRGRR